jgi:hypothetical protein
VPDPYLLLMDPENRQDPDPQRWSLVEPSKSNRFLLLHIVSKSFEVFFAIFHRFLDFTLSFAFTLVRAFHFFNFFSKFPSDNRILFLAQALVWRVWATFPVLVRCTLTIMKKYSGRR